MNNRPDRILEEALRLLDGESENLEIYKLNGAQREAIGEARGQFAVKTGINSLKKVGAAGWAEESSKLTVGV